LGQSFDIAAFVKTRSLRSTKRTAPGWQTWERPLRGESWPAKFPCGSGIGREKNNGTQFILRMS